MPDGKLESRWKVFRGVFTDITQNTENKCDLSELMISLPLDKNIFRVRERKLKGYFWDILRGHAVIFVYTEINTVYLVNIQYIISNDS